MTLKSDPYVRHHAGAMSHSSRRLSTWSDVDSRPTWRSGPEQPASEEFP